MIALYLVLACVCEYFLGSLSFARICTWWIARKDITQEGSNNPGTMNVLRTRGFGEAILTLVLDAAKVGVPALGMYFLFNHFFPGTGDFAYFTVSVSGIIGHCLPVYYKFKGGKGVACTFAMFAFNPHLWWISLICFAICFILFLVIVPYGFIVNLAFIATLTGVSIWWFNMTRPLYFAGILTIICFVCVLVYVLHHKNFYRLFKGTEPKMNFSEKVFGKRKSKKVGAARPEEQTKTKQDDK